MDEEIVKWFEAWWIKVHKGDKGELQKNWDGTYANSDMRQNYEMFLGGWETVSMINTMAEKIATVH